MAKRKKGTKKREATTTKVMEALSKILIILSLINQTIDLVKRLSP